MEDLELYQTNKFQTKVTQSLMDSLEKEVQEEFWFYVNNVPFIQRLISPGRKRAKDLNRDSLGRIHVDLSNPHLLEDMDYFREVAIHFQEHGCYTKLRVNISLKSEYMKWFYRELDRCWNGMVRESDGEWITGDMYFFLNYLIIKQTVVGKSSTGKSIGKRIKSLPECWEGIYWRFHYLDQARNAGLHGAEIASRGKGKSYSLAGMLTKLITIGLDDNRRKERIALIVADQKEYLIKDGTLNKFEDALDFITKHTEFPSALCQNSLTQMSWICGWDDKDNNKRGSQNVVQGVAIGDDPDKSRGKRSDLLIAEEYGMFPKFEEWWGTSMPNVQEGEIVFGLGFFTGTGGTEGSDFSGALSMIQNPLASHVYGVPNVYDAGSKGLKDTIFFYPAYVNYKPYYNKDGVSDVVGAIISELKQRYEIKYNSTDITKLTKRKAEFAFTLSDAIMRRDGTLYPVADLNDRVFELDNNPDILNRMYQGKLNIKDGQVYFEPDLDAKAIQEFPHSSNKLEGAVYIKNMPEKDSSGKVP